jgi:NAD(P)H-hydrate epimerase
MTRHPQIPILVRHLLRQTSKPLVIDADAISVFARQAHWFEKANGPIVLTPHPGELARLLGQDAGDIQADRYAAAASAAKTTDATVVLKGAGTIVAQHGKPTALNVTGNPGMATGGSGDVLSGLLVGLLAQGLDPYDAARAAVYLHGRAGDMVAWRASQAGLAAGDLIEELPYVFRELSFR